MVRRFRLIMLGRLAFCSEACLHNALEGDVSTGRHTAYISERIARIIKCYCCDCFIDEREKEE